MHSFRHLAGCSFPVLAALLLSSCAVGPDFERPPAPDTPAFESTPLPEKTGTADVENGGNAQAFVSGDIPGEWWTLFHSEPLNKLIDLSLRNNPDIESAQAALRQAHEQALAGNGALFPQVDAGLNVQREKLSSIAFGSSGTVPPFDLYNASVNVSYNLDVFGGVRRQIEALDAQEDYQRFELQAARITLTANVVTAAITEASLRAQIEATTKIIEDEQKSLDLLQNQFKYGSIAKAAVLQQNATLAQSKALLPPLEEQLAQTRHLLSVLAGQLPSHEPDATFTLSGLTLPDTLPVSLPSQLVDQRPDIKAAEATLHAASADIGVATANMLPQFTLTGDIGSDAGKLIGLLEPAGGIWSLAAGLTQPIFHGGELLHQKRASEAAYDQAAALYRKTVLAAFKDVADTLRALQSDAEALKAQAEAEHAAAESLELSRQQYKLGAINYLTLLIAEQTEQQTRLALVQAQARRYADTAALFTALGGGWWNHNDKFTETVAAKTNGGSDMSADEATARANPTVESNNPTPLVPKADETSSPAKNGDQE